MSNNKEIDPKEKKIGKKKGTKKRKQIKKKAT